MARISRLDVLPQIEQLAQHLGIAASAVQILDNLPPPPEGAATLHRGWEVLADDGALLCVLTVCS